ncbi:MAG: DDE-type integrase/transposase/recombinase [Cytophagaceae bacterium]|nr:DDE-type integrase/transposase/recombinase [Gemmatimonadaceae bacterium]
MASRTRALVPLFTPVTAAADTLGMSSGGVDTEPTGGQVFPMPQEPDARHRRSCGVARLDRAWQGTETWIRLLAEAFEYFGGVPAVVVPDNLKAAVIRAAFAIDDKSVLNRRYRELARHHGFKIDPTPPYTPKQGQGRVGGEVRQA